ncbi:hypothetical protein H1R20_g3299, partial [Candolleomyces eurysporus]
MATLLKAQTSNAAKADKKRKRTADAMDVDNDASLQIQPKRKKNKQRVMLLSSRGVTHRMRHLMNDLETLLPHVKKDAKLDSKNQLHLLPELADLNNCNNTLYFEARRHEDLYLWAAKTPNGPSIKMHVQNIHTMDELKMTGNCLKGSRGLLSFDKAFDDSEWGRLTKEVFTHIFGVPATARKAKPFIDHILTFSILDSKIWFRNFQIVEKDPLKPNGPPETSLVEIGPRFVLTPIRIFEGAFSGTTVYSNPEFISPAAYLDMYGDPDASTAYSLSGVVRVSVSSPYSLFERRRTAKLLLQSLSLTFEGQSEIYTHDTDYSALRLCAITRELAPSHPMEFTNEGHEEDSDPCQWDIVFNLPIPGWLPSSATLGMEDIGIRYGLYATAKFINLDSEQSASSWSFATFCTPFRSRIRSIDSRKQITVRRYVLPPHVNRPTTGVVNYLVNSHSPSEKTDGSKKRIPADVLSKIQVLASVPEDVDVEAKSVPITVRLRTKDLAVAECNRLQVTEVGINIVQQERWSGIYDVGLYLGREHSESVCRTFTLLPSKDAGKYQLSEDNYAFATDAEQGDNPTWYTMEAHIPFVHTSPADLDLDIEDWAGPAIIRPSSSSPLFSVSHTLAISLTFSYDVPDSDERARERLNFNIPLSFGRYLPSTPSVGSSPSILRPSDEAQPANHGNSTESSHPAFESPFSNLPPYSQLYDDNGDRKIDLSIPLPLYTPREETSKDENHGNMEYSSPTCPEEKNTTCLLVDTIP